MASDDQHASSPPAPLPVSSTGAPGLSTFSFTPDRIVAAIALLQELNAAAGGVLIAYNAWRLAPLPGAANKLQAAMDRLAVALYGEPPS